MSIELLRQADYVLSACGRPTPPPGARWIDLPYVLTFRAQIPRCGIVSQENSDEIEFCPSATLPANTNVLILITAPQFGIGPEAFSLTVTGLTIAIILQTDGGGAILTTGADIVTAIAGSAAASALVTATVVLAAAPPVAPTGTAGVTGGVQAGTGAASSRIENKARVEFRGRAVSIVGQKPVSQDGVPFRIWWPNGRNLEQLLSENNFAGSGADARTLQPEVIIDPGGKITIELGTPADNTNPYTVYFYFWGILRFLLNATGNEPQPYLPETSRAPRITGTQSQNLMAPEWMLGNQCCPETPEGFWDEPFTVYSDPIANPIGKTTVGVAVEFPKDVEVFIIRNVQWDSVEDETVTAGESALQIRLPSGYSVTNGDYLPQDWTGPMFPLLEIEPGGRVIIDAGDVDAAGTGNITTTVQFDGVKRRRLGVNQ